MQIADRSGLVDGEVITATEPASTSSGSETRASKNPTHRAAKKPPVQAVQNVQPFKSLTASSAEKIDPDVLAQEIVERLEVALEQFREIAV